MLPSILQVFCRFQGVQKSGCRILESIETNGNIGTTGFLLLNLKSTIFSSFFIDATIEYFAD